MRCNLEPSRLWGLPELFCVGCDQLEQGDYLPRFWVPIVRAEFDPAVAEPEISVGSSSLSSAT